MSSLTDQSPRVEAQPDPPRISPQKPLFRRFAFQIAFYISASICATILMNTVGIMNAARYACAAGSRILGDPWKGKGGIIKEIEDKIDDVKRPILPTAPSISLRPTDAELAAREKKDAKKVASRLDTLKARADAVGLEHDDTWTLGKFEVEVPVAERNARDATARKPLLAEADRMGVIVPDDWSNKKLKEELAIEVKFRRDDASYQEKLRLYRLAMARHKEFLENGPNARCPACGWAFRQTATKGQGQCKRCLTISPRSQSGALWRPPAPPTPPTPPTRKQGVFKRVTGFFFG